MLPAGQFRSLLQNLRAPREKWAHRKRKDLVVGSAADSLGDARRPRGNGCRHVPFDARPVPLPEHRREGFIAAERLDLLEIRFVKGAEPAKNICRLPYGQPQLGELERDVPKPEQRTRLELVRLERSFIEVERGQRDAGLDATLHFEQFEVHIHGIGKLGLSLLQGAKLDGLSGFRTAGARRTNSFVGHAAIISRPMT